MSPEKQRAWARIIRCSGEWDHRATRNFRLPDSQVARLPDCLVAKRLTSENQVQHRRRKADSVKSIKSIPRPLSCPSGSAWVLRIQFLPAPNRPPPAAPDSSLYALCSPSPRFPVSAPPPLCPSGQEAAACPLPLGPRIAALGSPVPLVPVSPCLRFPGSPFQLLCSSAPLPLSPRNRLLPAINIRSHRSQSRPAFPAL